MRGSWRTGSDLRRPGWRGRCETNLSTQQKLRMADLFFKGRFWVRVHCDTRFLKLNGNIMMNYSLLQTSDDSMISMSGLKSSLLT